MAWWNKDDNDSAGGENLPVPASKSSDSAAKSSPMASSSVGAASSAAKALDSDLETKYGTVRSALSDGTVIQGKLSFDTPVRIDGSLQGEVFSSSVLIVGPKGSVSADINVETLVILGSVSGEVKARKRLELHADGELVGTVETPSLLIADGAYFDGTCSMKVGEQKEEVAAETKKSAEKTGAKAPKVPIVTPKSDGSKTTSSTSVISAKGSGSAKDGSKSAPNRSDEKSALH